MNCVLGDINPSGESIRELAYEWADKDYKWDVDRDLKAREPLFGSGQYYKVYFILDLFSCPSNCLYHMHITSICKKVNHICIGIEKLYFCIGIEN